MDSNGIGTPVTFSWGTWLERPSATKLGAGCFYYVISSSPTSPDTLWATDIESGTITWKSVGGTGSSGSAMKYFVNNSPTASPQPSCLYSTIAAAQAAAVADLHNELSPAVIWICPTATLTENVTMAPGISLQGMVNSAFGAASPVITGVVDASLTSAGGSVILSNLIINGRLISGGTQTVDLRVNNVTVFQTDGALSPVSFTGTGLTVTGNNLSSFCVSLSALPAVAVGPIVSATLTEGQIIADYDLTALRVIHASDVIGATTVNLMEVRLSGAITIQDQATVTMRQCRVVTSSTMCTFTTAGFLNAFQCEIDIASGGLIATGTGEIRDVDCFFPQGTSGVGSSIVTSAVRYVHRLYTEIIFTGAGPYTVGAFADLYLVDTASGDKVVTIPALNTVPRGTRFSFQKITSVANTVTITPTGSDTIASGASFVLAAGSLTGATFQAGALDWRRVQ